MAEALAKQPPQAGDPAPSSFPKDKKDPLPSTSSDTDDVENTEGINEKALLRKIDWRLLPAVGILYLLSFLDRSNVGNARVEGLADDVGMTGNQYLTGLTLYFVGYVIFEVCLSSPLTIFPLSISPNITTNRYHATSSSNAPHPGFGSQP